MHTLVSFKYFQDRLCRLFIKKNVPISELYQTVPHGKTCGWNELKLNWKKSEGGIILYLPEDTLENEESS